MANLNDNSKMVCWEIIELGIPELTLKNGSKNPLTLILLTHYTSATPGHCFYVCGQFFFALAEGHRKSLLLGKPNLEICF